MTVLTELFANQATTTVSSGGTGAPASGTQETWTVASSAAFPAASSATIPATQFHVCDTTAGKTSEIIAVTNVSGTTWTVTRGAEGSAPIAHAAGFTVQQVASAGALTTLNAFPLVTQAQRITTTSDLTTDTLTSSTPPAFTSILASGPGDVIVDPGETYQQFLGVGAALTDSACYVLTNYMTPTQRTALLTYLFSPAQCGWSMVRIIMGWQGFSHIATPYTYDDMPSGQTDTGLINFSVLTDTSLIIPVLQEILAINPGVRILAAPCTPPQWMLSAGTIGVAPETFNDTYMSAWAQYFVEFIQAYQSYGIPVWAVTPQNEPVQPTYVNFSQSEETTFVGTYLGPALIAAGLGNVKIFAYDDNWSHGLTYPEGVLSGASGPYTDGVAWHGYAGSPTVMSQLQGSYPDTIQILSEWRSLSSESQALQMQGMAGGYVAGGAQNGAAGILLWNLALDQNGNPNQSEPGRIGAVTVNNSTGAVTYNAGFYALTHLGKQVQPGARRCQATTFGTPYTAYSTYPSQVTTCAWVNPDRSVVLYAYNGSGSSQTCQVIDRRTGTGFPVTMVSGELSTFTWGTSRQASPAVSPSVPAAPGAPVLTATASAGQVSLSWTVPTSQAPVDYYVIGRATSSGQETTLVQVASGTTSYLDLTGASGTWYYTVTAVSAGGTGTASTEKSATATSATAPAAPVISAQSTGTSVTLSWSAPSPNGATVTSFNILRGTSSGGETSLGTASQGATSYTDSTGSIGTTYYYKVQAVNSVGTSASSNEVTGEPTGITLDAVSTSNGTTNATFSWNHAVGSGVHGLLYVAVGYAGPSSGPGIASVTYGGTALTKLATEDPSPGAGTDKALDTWYLVNPAAGTAAIAVTTNAGWTTALINVAASYFGVNQSTPHRTAAGYANTSSNAPTASTTGGTASDLVLAALHMRGSGTVTAGAGQAVVESGIGGTNNQGILTSQTGGSGTITSSFSWSAADMTSLIAVALEAG